MTRRHIEIAVIGILIIAIILYAAAGIVYAGVLTASADRALNVVASHQNSLNTSFTEINNEVGALGGDSAFNPQLTVAVVDRAAANSAVELATINQDDASLASVQGQLNGSRWLTLVGRTGLDHETSKVDHARSALAVARTISTDGVLDLRFWHFLYTALVDLETLNTQAGGGDLNAAKTTLGQMQTDVGQAIQQSTAPGLPSDLRSLMVDLQTFGTDYGKQLDAQIAGDDATVAQYQSTINSDRQKLGSYDVDRIQTDINAFYKPLVDRFNSEMAAATS